MDIFVINKSDINNIEPELLEQFRYKTISNKNKLSEHCLSYLMLDRILKEVYKIENRELEFVKGKPYLKNRQKFFSISHSGEYVLIGFSDSECGVDIEKIKNRDIDSISKRMNFRSKTLDDFYKDWTKYEAEYKLGQKCAAFFQNSFHGYMITSVCSNIQEKFNFYIQNGEKFSNL